MRYKKTKYPNKHLLRHSTDGPDVKIDGKDYPRGKNPRMQLISVKISGSIDINPDPGSAQMRAIGFEKTEKREVKHGI